MTTTSLWLFFVQIISTLDVTIDKIISVLIIVMLLLGVVLATLFAAMEVSCTSNDIDDRAFIICCWDWFFPHQHLIRLLHLFVLIHFNFLNKLPKSHLVRSYHEQQAVLIGRSVWTACWFMNYIITLYVLRVLYNSYESERARWVFGTKIESEEWTEIVKD